MQNIKSEFKVISPMKNLITNKIINIVTSVILTLYAGLSTADDTEEVKQEMSGPQLVVQILSDDLIALVESQRNIFKKDPQPFYIALGHLMDPVVSFRYIAKNVMGKTHYKAANAEQRAQFVGNFRAGLIRTYAKGFFNYKGEEIIIHPNTEKLTIKSKKATILQEVKTEGSGLKIFYSMGKNKSDEWKLLNMSVNGVNLGITLNKQFQTAMQKNNDLDTVIAEWATDSAKK